MNTIDLPHLKFRSNDYLSKATDSKSHCFSTDFSRPAPSEICPCPVHFPDGVSIWSPVPERHLCVGNQENQQSRKKPTYWAGVGASRHPFNFRVHVAHAAGLWQSQGPTTHDYSGTGQHFIIRAAPVYVMGAVVPTATVCGRKSVRVCVCVLSLSSQAERFSAF